MLPFFLQVFKDTFSKYQNPPYANTPKPTVVAQSAEYPKAAMICVPINGAMICAIEYDIV
jgi:hypothetical protein